MPAPCTATDFLAIARKSRVVDEAALSAFEHRLADTAERPPARELANIMVREGLLTKLQASQLLRGRWKNFFICEKYKLLEYLGTGGMGQVYLCEHTRMGRRVAVKVLPPDKAAEKTCRERFDREARAGAALDHPNLVRTYDIDQDRDLQFLVMEYVDGTSLQEIVSRSGPLSIERSCHYVARAAFGLQHAHEAGLVHRDIKPANLILERSGQVKILDLGLARFLNDTADDLTRNMGGRSLIGTADYLAPEQALDSHGADIRADIYSLGVTFFFLLTGRSPFKEGTIRQKLIYHQRQRPEPIRAIRPDVPDGVAKIIDRMLAKAPSERFQEPIDVATALDPWTGTPIPPPPEAEMPRLSRAARRSESPTLSIPHSSRPTILTHRRPVAPELPPLPTPEPPPRSGSFVRAWAAAVAKFLSQIRWRRRSRQVQQPCSTGLNEPGC
jgi:serine/threonine protein kinase